MTEILQTPKIDKSKWGPGPWQNEPDRIEFEYKGMPCLMHRARMGNWCGYVAVGPGHPWHWIGYSVCTLKPRCEKDQSWNCDHTPDAIISVHGGLTYSGPCEGHICHVPKPGDPDNVFWFGFDCAHAGDGMPWVGEVMSKESGFWRDGYKDATYVRREIERLADQLKAVA